MFAEFNGMKIRLQQIFQKLKKKSVVPYLCCHNTWESNDQRITSNLTNLRWSGDNKVNMWWKCFNAFME